MSENVNKKPAKSATRPVRISSEVANFLDEKSDAENLSHSEIMDEVLAGYRKYKSGESFPGSTVEKTDKLGSQQDAASLKILTELESLQAKIVNLQAQFVSPTEREQNDIFPWWKDS